MPKLERVKCKIDDDDSALSAAKQNARREKCGEELDRENALRAAANLKQKLIVTQARLGIELAKAIISTAGGKNLGEWLAFLTAKAQELLDAGKA